MGHSSVEAKGKVRVTARNNCRHPAKPGRAGSATALQGAPGIAARQRHARADPGGTWGREGLGCPWGGTDRAGGGTVCTAAEFGVLRSQPEPGGGVLGGGQWDPVAVLLPEVGSWVCWRGEGGRGVGKGGCLSPSSRSLMGSRWDGWDHSCSLCPPSTRIRELPQEEAPRPPHYLSKTHSTSLLTRRYDFISSHPAPTADLPLAYGVGRSSRTPSPPHTPQDPLEPPGPGPPRLRSTASDPTAERDSTRSEVTRSRGPARFPPAPGVLCPPGAAPGAPHAATHLHPEAVTWPADVTARQPGLAAPRAARCPSPKAQ